MNTYTHSNNPGTIADIIVAQCLANPYAVAVECRDHVLTYRELLERSNRLANYLAGRGITKEMIVPVFMEHSVDIVVAILAVLKTGAAYLPIDAEFPPARVQCILEDAAPLLMITSSACAAKLNGRGGVEVMVLDLQWPSVQLQPVTLAATLPDKTNLAYVIYTSGSTGKPKGVMVEHAQIFSYTVSACDKLGLNFCERIGLVGTFAADACLMALFGSLCCGKRLYIIDVKKMPGFRDIVHYFETRALDCYKTTPSLMASFVQQKEVKRMLPSKRLLLGGEECPPSLIEALCALLEPSCALINHYGPTETTVAVLTYQFPTHAFDGNVLLGQPLGDTEVHILDDNLEPLPAGAIGELCISGSFVARGYLNNPVLTHEKFICKTLPGKVKRLYRTGDLVMVMPDGNIKNFGRTDDQVKINGHRVELREIEHQVMQSRMAHHCLVMAKQTHAGEKRLTAYINPAENFDQASLTAFMQAALPLYMVPRKYVLVQEWPRTINNKADREFLASLDSKTSLPVEQPAFPAHDVIGRLKNIWSAELGIDVTDENADFFEMGGDSLQLIRLSFAIEDQLGVAIAPYELFGCLTLQTQSDLIVSKSGKRNDADVTARPENMEASKAQMNLFVQHRLNPSESFPNISITLEIAGHIDTGRLNNCFIAVIENNESLRTSFFLTKGKLQQQIHQQFSFNLITHDAVTNDIDAEVRALTLPFQLDKAPLIRGFIIALPNAKRFLHLDMPHIIADGESIKVIMDELEALYNDNYDQSGKKQFRDYQQWASQYFHSSAYYEDERYWSGQLAGKPRQVNFPPRKQDGSRFSGVQVVRALPLELVACIKEFATSHHITRFQLFYAAYLMLLHERFANQEFLVMIPVHNRQARAFRNVTGLLTNVIVQRSSIDPEISFVQFVKMLHGNMLEALKHQRYPFESLVALWKHRGYDLKDLFTLFFGYHFHREEYLFGNTRLRLHIPCVNKENVPLSAAVFETENEIFIKLSSANVFTAIELATLVQSFFELLNTLTGGNTSNNKKLFHGNSMV